MVGATPSSSSLQAEARTTASAIESIWERGGMPLSTRRSTEALPAMIGCLTSTARRGHRRCRAAEQRPARPPRWSAAPCDPRPGATGRGTRPGCNGATTARGAPTDDQAERERLPLDAEMGARRPGVGERDAAAGRARRARDRQPARRVAAPLHPLRLDRERVAALEPVVEPRRVRRAPPVPDLERRMIVDDLVQTIGVAGRRRRVHRGVRGQGPAVLRVGVEGALGAEHAQVGEDDHRDLVAVVRLVRVARDQPPVDLLEVVRVPVAHEPGVPAQAVLDVLADRPVGAQGAHEHLARVGLARPLVHFPAGVVDGEEAAVDEQDDPARRGRQCGRGRGDRCRDRCRRRRYGRCGHRRCLGHRW